MSCTSQTALWDLVQAMRCDNERLRAVAKAARYCIHENGGEDDWIGKGELAEALDALDRERDNQQKISKLKATI